MRIERLTEERVGEFIGYCKRYKKELDDSFLYDEDLRNFKPDNENPTYIAVDDSGEITGTASLIIDDRARAGRKARFRVFHSKLNDFHTYEVLLEAILNHKEGLDNVFLFVPIVNEQLIKAVESIKFKVERYSFLLVREDLEVPDVALPEGYRIKSFKIGEDEEIWCQVRNASFTNLRGNETPITPETVKRMNSGEDFIEGGCMILFHEDKPVGVVRDAKDDFEDKPIMNIGPLAIIPEYQGKGLGRQLLRQAIKFAKENGYGRTVLCVNAENERAKALYLQEGFNQVEAVACYKYDI
jgi:mycothiol synthase